MKGTVMIVEDDGDIREALATVLADEGMPALTAANGQDALVCLRTSPEAPMLIVLDLMMPVMDGWQFAAALRAQPSWARIPIVLLSAGDDLETHAKNLGACSYVRKPVDLEKLLGVVEQCAGNGMS
jgi:two-component system, chemotaxis family, chemotaxis protein CheY